MCPVNNSQARSHNNNICVLVNAKKKKVLENNVTTDVIYLKKLIIQKDRITFYFESLINEDKINLKYK